MKFARITDEAINSLVRAFYEKVRLDPRLAPIFTETLGDRWGAHISRMCDFWGSAMRVSKRYRGDMLATHRRVARLRPALFEHWLRLFDETVGEHFSGGAAEALRDRAHKTARNLELALFHRVDKMRSTFGQARSDVPGAAPTLRAAMNMPEGGSGD